MQRLGYCLMKKIRNVLYKDWQGFFSKTKKTFHPTIPPFTQGEIIFHHFQSII